MRALTVNRFLAGLLVSSGLFVACGGEGRDDGDSGSGAGGNGSGGDTSAGGGSASGGTGTGGVCIIDCNGSGGGSQDDECGDGNLTDGEACDDDNLDDGDGCSADCLHVEPGYSCAKAGIACQKISLCGDGVLSGAEVCDDGNPTAGDGCSPYCKLEEGYKCDDSEPSVCSKTVCGDGKIEGTETCEDGNKVPFDGCSATCRLEPKCTQSGCTSDCGDGLVIGEACDDGNLRDGDGCSANCQVEDNYECNPSTELSSTLVVPILYRDFRQSGSSKHPSFGDGCGADQITAGLVKLALDAEGKPEYSGTADCHIGNQATFESWYRPTSSSKSYLKTLTLNKGTGNVYAFDSGSGFFPLDGEVFPTNPEPAGHQGHNFGFTSEVHYWFEYQPADSAQFGFTGDDDVWVFVNGRLVVDLGGIHSPVSGSFTLNDGTKDVGGTPLGLVPGNVYEIAVFQAERHETGSNYKLTLSGFNTSASLCLADCGDGIIGLNEECDDGDNDGGYGECGVDCKLGEFCGDGVRNGPEDCDDGNRIDTDECNNSCRELIFK